MYETMPSQESGTGLQGILIQMSEDCLQACALYCTCSASTTTKKNVGIN